LDRGKQGRAGDESGRPGRAEAGRRRSKESKMQRGKDEEVASGSGLMAQPVGWDGNRYTINIRITVPDVKSFLIICSIH